MNRPGLTFSSLVLIFLTGSTVSAAAGGQEDGKDGFFAPGPGFFDPRQDASTDFANGPNEPPNLFKQIGTDFRNVFTTKENLLIIGAGLGAAFAEFL